MKAVIFDVDGTLTNSVDLHTDAWQRTFAHFGHKIPHARIRSQIGKGGDQLMPVFLSSEEIDKKGKEIEQFRGDLFKAEYLAKVNAFPQVRELFQRLLADNYKLALASSAKSDELETYKKICRIDDLLHTETSSDDAEKSKPYPDIFQAALVKLGKMSAADCLVIGDSPYDAEAARKAGMRAIGFLSGGFPENNLRAAGFETIYQGAEDLLQKYTDTVLAREAPKRSS